MTNKFDPDTQHLLIESWPNQQSALSIPFPVWRYSDFDEYVHSELSDFVKEHTKSIYFVRISAKSMVCVLTLKNGFDIRGESGVINPTRFKPVIGAKYALHTAVDKASTLIAYMEQQKLSEGKAYTQDQPQHYTGQ